MKKLSGNGFSITLKNCEKDITNNEKEMKEFLETAVECVKMNKLGEPVFRKGSDHLPGISGVQIIETSHIALHGFSKSKSYMFSIESCKRFDVNLLKLFLIDYFNPKDYKINTTYEVEV